MAYIFQNTILELMIFIVSFIIYAYALNYFDKYSKVVEDYSTKKFKDIDKKTFGTTLNFKFFIDYHRETHKVDEELEEYKTNLKRAKLTGLIIVSTLGTDIVFALFPRIINLPQYLVIIKYTFLVSSIVFTGYFYDIVYTYIKMKRNINKNSSNT